MPNLTSVGIVAGIPNSGTGNVSTIDQMLAQGVPISNGSTASQAAITGASSVPTSSMSALVVAISPNGVNANGQATMVNSAPVVIASNQTSIPVAGDVASGVANSGNPLQIGGLAATSNPVAVANAQRVGALFDKVGKQIVVGSVRALKGIQVTAISSTTETNVVTASSLVFNDIYGCVLANTGGTATSVTIKDSSGGTTRMVFQVPSGDTRGFMLPEGGALPQATSSAAWTATLGSVTTLTVTMLYVQNI